VADLTGCDKRTVEHWVAYYQEHQSLEDEPRSGRPRVTTEATDTSIVAAATENPITTPPTIRRELGVEASACTESRQIDSVARCGAVRRNENQHTVPRFQFSHEHQN
jgi:transposase